MAQTLKNYLQSAGVDTGLARILLDLAGAFPVVAGKLRGRVEGEAGTKNVFGEDQLALDVAANNYFLDLLKKNPHVAAIASEEMPVQEKGQASADGYSVAFDPLDGSSLVDVNLAVGSIFGVYKGAGFVGRTGSEQVASLIVVYGPRLSMMISVGAGTLEFLYDEEAGDFVFACEIKLDKDKKIFAPGNLRACGSERWYLDLMEYWVKSGYTLRYSGGMVPDVNQILKKGGGVFAYPGYKEKPEGKLRLLYECAPIAFLVEQAGGVAIAGGVAVGGGAENPGRARILDIGIDKLDRRTPVFLGSKKEIDLVRSYLEKV